MGKNAALRTKIVDALVLHLFLRAWLAKTPNLSTMADDAITRGGIGGLGSPAYIYMESYCQKPFQIQISQL